MKKSQKTHKLRNTILILLLLAITGAGTVFGLKYFNDKNQNPAEETTETPAESVEQPKFYSKLTGELLTATTQAEADARNEKPLYCVQIPNGMDGARPQIGLNQTAIVFEAVAEAGITRFAAIFQPQDDSFTIGPIRSLRQYYLDWDTPFDCTIVHAGGSPDAIASVRAGNYRDLSESLTYMWRDYSDRKAPNNLFTSTNLLGKFNASKKYHKSNYQAFARVNSTPVENEASADETSDNTNSENVKSTKQATKIAVNFNSMPNFNTVWTYDENKGVYLRSYASKTKHETYACPTNDKSPKNLLKNCTKEQIETKNLAVMMVSQARRAGDKKQRTDVATTGKGKAYVFKNGQAIKATWYKKNQKSQLIFKDQAGNEIAFEPGRLWIAAVPKSSGSVKY